MTETTTGVLEIHAQGHGYLRDPDHSFKPKGDDVYVPRQAIAECGLVAGATVCGPVRKGKKGIQLSDITTICGVDPEVYGKRPNFKELTALNPERRFDLGAGGLQDGGDLHGIDLRE